MNIHKNMLSQAIILFSLYHTSAFAFNLNNLWQKTEVQKIRHEYQVGKACALKLYNTEGSYTIKYWIENKITIEAEKKGTAEELKDTTIGCTVSTSEARITTRHVEGQPSAQVHYTLMVPEDASITIEQTKGPVTIKGVLGSINISLQEGPITIDGSTKSVIAKTGQGAITVDQKKLEEPYSIFLESHKGNVTLLLPRETHALLNAKTAQGTIISEHPVTLAPVTMKITKDAWESLKKNVEGTLGGLKGGAPINLEATKGNIVIKES